jgi:hypothetical protein
MRKTFVVAVSAVCVAVLAVAVFAGSAKLEPRAANAEPLGVADAEPLGQEPREWQKTQPIRYEPFEVEVLVGGSTLEQYPARGRVYVEAVGGAEYELRVRNPLPVRVAVALSVDGLNTIDARHSAARDASKWIIEPYGTITISGWQMSRTRARRFYFTTERDSYGNKLGRTEDLGVIAAAFFRERAGQAEAVPPPRPLNEPERREQSEMKSSPTPSQSSSRAAGTAGAGQPKDRSDASRANDEFAATGIGRSVGNDVRWVNLDLERDPAAEVTIRYEYRPALVRLGILPRLDADRDPLRRRERARGFADPRYCPEP